MKIDRHSNKPCPIAQTLGIIGDSWTLLVLRNSFMGTTRFDDFQQQLGLSRHLLTERLKKLVKHGLLTKVPYGEHGGRYEYRLTEKGASLSPVFIMLATWGNEWLFEKSEAPFNYVHNKCGQHTKVGLTCSCCGQNLEGNEIKIAMNENLRRFLDDMDETALNNYLGFPFPH